MATTASPSTTKARSLRIIVIGDLFQERYHAPAFARSGEDPPFGAPDELRSRRAVQVFIANSGIAIHRQILNELFQIPEYFGFNGREPPLEGDQSQSRTQNSKVLRLGDTNIAISPSFEAINSIDWTAFPAYLHELSTFSVRDSIDGKRVWRISQTFGFYRDAASKMTNVAATLQQLNKLTSDAISNIPASKPDKATAAEAFLFVINDRGLGFRDCQESITQLMNVFSTLATQKADFLIIWHIRMPRDLNGPLAKAITQSAAREHTIVVINHQCLRDEGINIRFDVSYEHTFADFLACMHDQHHLLQGLLTFPQLLVRFDYGVLHVGTECPASLSRQPSRTCEMGLVDVHGLVGGPFHQYASRHGIVTGRTFLLVAALIGEAARWYVLDSTHRLSDVLNMERRPQEPASLDADDDMAKLRDPSRPTVLRNTVIDQAVDVGILLNSHHFADGFGSFQAGRGPFEEAAEYPVEDHFKTLLTAFSRRLKRRKESTITNSALQIAFEHDDDQRTRLTRYALEKAILEWKPDIQRERNYFSRVSLLRDPEVVLRGCSAIKSELPGGLQARASIYVQDRCEEVALRRIVTHGIRALLCQGLASEDEPWAHAKKAICEPSVVVPFVEFGEDLVTLDRREIDGYLSIRYLIDDYLGKARQQGDGPILRRSRAPLSISVFGPPGSGKSRTVRQILASVGKGLPGDVLTFNLSEFRDPSDLSRAFHRIQDRALAQQIPVAFFDEFDASFKGEALGWLKYFLAPMQDGKFFDEAEVYHVGPAIFVFCGGTTPTFHKFVKRYGQLSAQKAPDFISRLRGHLDIRDISTRGKVNLRLRVRRALLLRSLLKEFAPTVFDETGEVASIDGSVLNAFLHIPRFEHGVRSMQAIIEMSRLGEAGAFQKSSLPTSKQLGMHVDAGAFLDLVNGSSQLTGHQHSQHEDTVK